MSGKCVFGAPPDAEKVRYQRYYADKLGIPAEDTLTATCMAALAKMGEGAPRVGGECKVPLYVWNTQPFQNWYANQKTADNRLDDARVEWSFRVGPKRNMFLYSLWVDVHIGKENRNKTNEIVVFRPDISAVVMYCLPSVTWTPRGSTIFNTRVVLVKEFRSPVSNTAGYVYELPGGSAKGDPRAVAAEEVEEETGLRVSADRLTLKPTRQLAATLSAHRGTLFAVELSTSEIDLLAAEAAAGVTHGVEADTERTYVEVRTVREIVEENLVDWSTLGMIFNALA